MKTNEQQIKTTSTLPVGWPHTHVPAPGSFREYNPKMAIADTDEAPGDLCGLGGEHDTGSQLRSIHRASQREQDRLERSMR